MIRQITGTIAARVTITAMGLVVTMIAGHRLGTVGLGTIGLVVLGITLVMLAANIIGGGAIVFLVPRVPLRQLLGPAYAWAAIACLLGYGIIKIFPLVPAGFEEHVAVLAFMQAIYGIHLSVLIGQQRIRVHNMITVLQSAVLLATFWAFSRSPSADAFSYVEASYAAFGSTLLFSALMLRDRAPSLTDAPANVFRMLLRQGGLVQSANALQLLNYRLAYWLIEHFRGTAALGVYSVGNQLAEGAWLGPKSLGLVLYSRVSNSADPGEQRMLALTILKVSMACTLAVVAVLLIIPAVVFSWAFGPEVMGLTPIIAVLAPGIMAMAASQAFSHFFSGTARNKHNMLGSGIGLVVTVAAGFLLIPAYGLVGAAASATLAYCTNALYQMVIFLRVTRSTLMDLLPNAADILQLKEIIRRPLGR